MSTPTPNPEMRFRALYMDSYPDVLRFAQRRTSAMQAEDVTADAFLVAWRRFEEAPTDPGDQRAWLFGIARNCLLNARRGEDRRDALAVRLAAASAVAGTMNPPDDDLVAQQLDFIEAWGTLTESEQETLSLAVFEGLTSGQAARVLGISSTSYRLRLLRVRRVLRRQLHIAGSAAHAGMETVI